MNTVHNVLSIKPQLRNKYLKIIVWFDIITALKDGDVCCQTLMSERENVLSGIDISVVRYPTLRA
jgi:hypothetical protein